MKLKGICRRYTGDDAIAEDLVQETFITAIDKLPTFKGLGSLDGWIRKIAVNKALLYLRDKKMSVPIETAQYLSEQETEIELPMENRRLVIERVSFTTDELLMVIDALPVHHRAVFNLYVLDGYSHQQIARLMNISTGTSKSHLSRARKKAQELLYEQAIQKQPEQKRRLGMFLLFLFRPHYIDSLFRRGFGNFALPVNIPKFIPSSGATIPLKWFATIAGKVLLIGSTVSVVAVVGYFGSTLKSSQPSVKSVAPIEVVSPAAPGVIVPPDTLSVAEKKISQPERVTKQKKERVIVKKTIIVRDTIRMEKPSVK